MKRRLLATLITVCLMAGLLPGRAWAAEEFVVNEKGVLTEYHGAGGDVIIPGTVTSIGDRAFIYNITITSVSIPGSVTSIGEEAFKDCTGLVSISIPDSVTSIGDDAFYDCTGLVSVSVPASVTSIGTGAFFGCTGLISSGPIGGEYSYKFGWMNEIPANAFAGCEGLTSISIPDSVTSIGRDAFDSCASLTDIDIPDGVITIEDYAFWRSGLTNINIPNSVTSIGNRAFWYCTSLTTVNIPDSVKVIGYEAFADCTSLTSIDIPVGITSMKHHVFAGCTNLAEINISNSVISIEDYAFSDCISLTSVNIPKGVTNIWYSAFSGCSGLTSVTIPDSVTSIGPNAFSGSSLTDIYYAGTMEQWNKIDKGSGCFGGRPNITIHYNSTEPDNPDNPGEDLGTKNISGVLRSGDGCRVLWQCAYQVGKDIPPQNGKIKIFTSSTDTVDEELFLYNESAETGFPYPWELEPYNLPKSAITSIQIVGEEHKQLRVPANAFRGYDQLKQVTLDCVSAVDNSAFADCALLQSATFSDTVKHIGANAFQNTDLKTIKLGRNVETIGENAFAGCASLKIRCYKDSTAHQYAVENSIPFELIGAATIEIPCGGGVTETFSHDLDYLVDNAISTIYNPELSHMLIALSNAAYDMNYIRQGFSHLGFSQCDRHWCTFITFNIGTKKQNDGCTLALVVVRGSEGDADWWSNFDIRLNSSRFHTGFADAANEVYTQLINKVGAENLSSTKFVITGHSRGAAVANLLEVKLSELGVPRENVYGYNFACPDVAVGLPTRWNWMGEHNNIFNINNAPDPVSMIPGVLGNVINLVPATSWGKFGQSFWFARNWNNLDELALDFSAHDQKQYLNYLRTEPSISAFKDWTSRILALPAAQVQTIGKAIGICCPVDVLITDVDKNPMVSIVDGTVEYYDAAQDKVLVFVEGDKKAIFVRGNTPLMVQLAATGSGTMDYIVQTIKFDSGEVLSQKSFANVSIDTRKQMLSMTDVEEVTGVGTDVSKVPLYVLGSDDNPEKEVLPDGNGTEVPITKPDDPDNPDTPDDPVPVTYTITFDPNGGSVASTSAKTGADGKLATLPTPTRTSYNFRGWHTAISGGTVITTDTVFTRDTTVYAHWNYNGPSEGGPTSGDVIYPSGGNGSGSSTSTPSYSITTPSVTGGTITISPKSATKGTVVTITAKPDSGYELVSLTIIDSSDKKIALTDQGNGRYTFTMPGDKVTVNAEFQPVSASTTEPTPENSWSNPFTDVAESSWYYEAVRYVSENGLMNGVSSTVFAPEANLSRAMLAQILYNKAGKPSVTANSTFTDVTSGEWYSDAVTWAAANNIVGGYGNGRFGPNDNITREQLAVMLWRYAREPATAIKELNFSDANEASGYALNALCWATENGIINGKGDNILDPKGFATRAQVAQMLMNYLKA